MQFSGYGNAKKYLVIHITQSAPMHQADLDRSDDSKLLVGRGPRKEFTRLGSPDHTANFGGLVLGTNERRLHHLQKACSVASMETYHLATTVWTAELAIFGLVAANILASWQQIYSIYFS